MKIGNFDTDKKILIIAEIGNNHEGNFDTAVKMIESAAKVNVDAVKFQTIIPENLISIKQTERINQLKKFQLTHDEFINLKDIAEKRNLIFLSTPFDLESAKFLEKLVPAYKIASGDINFFPMIEQIAKTNKPIILSTGASTLEEIKSTKKFIKKIWKINNIIQEIGILHCISCYPTPIDQANMNSIDLLKKEFCCTIGYSDHTIGIDAALIAASKGARIIEKHFTIDKNLSNFRDHQLSADPNEMKELVDKIKSIEKYLGIYSKQVMSCEKTIKESLRRRIIAKKFIPKQKKIEMDDIIWVRAKNGLSPGEEKTILGKITKKEIKKGDPILKELIS